MIKRHPETRELAELVERERQKIDLITICANRLQGMVDDYWWLDRGTRINDRLSLGDGCEISIEYRADASDNEEGMGRIVQMGKEASQRVSRSISSSPWNIPASPSTTNDRRAGYIHAVSSHPTSSALTHIGR